jgi:peptide/nickel transport system permease protein
LSRLGDLKLPKSVGPRMREYRRTLHLLKTMPLSLMGLGIAIAMIFAAIFGPSFAPYDPLRIEYDERLLPPSSKYLLGTDSLGRDILSRIIFGTSVSMSIGVMVVVVSVASGTVLGLVAGYLGGKVDNVIMRATDIFLAFPGLVLAMAFAAAMKPSLGATTLALSIVGWPTFARIVKGSVLSIKGLDFVEAARAGGESEFSIVFNHILPNVFSPILVQGTLGLGRAIMLASTLGFIGLGVQPPTAEWGAMTAEGRDFILNQWWVSTFPGLMIFFAVMAFNLLGDGLRDALDPRLRYR